VPGLAAQQQGWSHRTRGDGGDAFHHPHVTVPSWVDAELVDVHLLKVSSSSFEGCNVEEVREWAAQCHGMTLASPHRAWDGRIVAGWSDNAGI
jgi:hypothetical protein